MKRPIMLGVLAGTAALALSFEIAPTPEAPSAKAGFKTSLLSDTLSPRALCRGGSNAASRRLRLRMAKALATEAETGSASFSAPPLVEGLGAFSYKVSTSVPEAQAYFDQGLKYTYAFNHHEAIRSFRAAQERDPDCAMCYWGEAFAWGPNINAAMEPGVLPQARAALAQARAHKSKASEKERTLIDALAVRYTKDGADADAFADAMVKAAKRFAADDHIQALAAEAIMDAQPWDYWNADGTPKGRAGEALDLVRGVLKRNPTHIPSIHLYIHLTEASPTPSEALEPAKRLAALAPAAGHLVHMPAHTYFRIGMYKASLKTNIKAVAADEAYLAKNRPSTIYGSGYYPHNVHFVLVSAQAMGARETAKVSAEKLAGLITPEVMRAAPWTQAIAAAPWMAQVQFADHDAVLAVERPDDAFPFLTVHWHYARALSLLAKGRRRDALKEAGAIGALAGSDALAKVDEEGLPATAIAGIAEDLVRGRAAWISGDLDGAIAHLKDATAKQEALPYTEPPFWYYPVAQTLGAVYLQAGRHQEAERAFRRALTAFPGNGWALFGLMKTYEAMGQTETAAEARALFEAAWVGAEPPALTSL